MQTKYLKSEINYKLDHEDEEMMGMLSTAGSPWTGDSMEYQVADFACCDRCGMKLVCPKCVESTPMRVWNSAVKSKEQVQTIKGKSIELGSQRSAEQRICKSIRI